MELVTAFAVPFALVAVVVTTVVLLRRRDGGRAEASLRRHGLREVAEVDGAFDRLVSVERRRRGDANVSRLVGLDVGLLRSTNTSEIRPKQAWIADRTDRPGVIGGFRVHIDATSSSIVSYRKSTNLGGQVVVARLPFHVDGRFVLEPCHVGFDPRKVDGLADALDRVAPLPRAVEDDVLGRWWLSLDGNGDSPLLRTDRRLRALLWALRTKVSGARDHIDDAERAELETLLPDVPRVHSMTQVVIDGDLLVLVGTAAPWAVGLGDALLDVAAAATA